MDQHPSFEPPEQDEPDDYEWKDGFYTKTLALSISLGQTRSGYLTVAFSEIQDFMVFFFNWDSSEKDFYQGFITSVYTLGAIFGMLLILAIIKRIGRKMSSLAMDLVALVGVIITLFASPAAFIIGRFVVGIAAGGDSVLIPIYLKEISSVDRRGLILGMSGFLWVAGVLVSYSMDLGLPVPDSQGVYTQLDDQWWRLQFGLPILVSVFRITLVNVIYNFETPMFVFQSASLNKEYKAREALAKIVRSDVIPKYMKEVICESEECRNRRFVTLKELFGFAYKRAIVLLSIMGAFVILSGGDLILSYLPRFISGEDSQIDITLKRGLKVIVGGILILGIGLNMVLSDKIGRRNFLLIGGISITTSLLLISGLNLQGNLQFEANVGLMFVYFFFMYFTYGSAYYTYFAEILPDIGVTYIYMYLRAIFFVLQFVFPAILNSLGRNGLLAIFGVSTGISFGFVLFFLPSTKNRAFSKIFAAFHGSLFVYSVK